MHKSLFYDITISRIMAGKEEFSETFPLDGLKTIILESGEGAAQHNKLSKRSKISKRCLARPRKTNKSVIASNNT